MKTRILIGTLVASMLAVIFAPAMLIGPASAGWHGTRDMFGEHWRSDSGQRFTCTTNMFGTDCR